MDMIEGIIDEKDGKILKETGDLYDEISTKYPCGNYTQFCNKLGVGFAQSQRILKTNQSDYKAALTVVLNIWEGKENATRAKLESALKNAETGALCAIVKKHFAKVDEEEESDEDTDDEEEESDEDTDDEEEESDEDALSQSRPKRTRKSITKVNQSGGAQTINASGKAKVKGNRMTGSITNITIHNRASGKAARSTGKRSTKRKAEEYIPGPSHAKSKKRNIKDSDIEKLAKDIGTNPKMEDLGHYLGFGFSAMRIYKAQNHEGGHVSCAGTKQMLIDWREEKGQGKSSILKKALIKAKLTMYAVKYFKDTDDEEEKSDEVRLRANLKRESESTGGKKKAKRRR